MADRKEYKSAWTKQDRLKNPEKYANRRKVYVYPRDKDYHKAYREKNKERIKARAPLYRYRKYGLEYEEAVLLLADNLACNICGHDFSEHKACIDHCHETSKIRGVLCDACNKMLGFARDDVVKLRSAIAYLEK